MLSDTEDPTGAASVPDTALLDVATAELDDVVSEVLSSSSSSETVVSAASVENDDVDDDVGAGEDEGVGDTIVDGTPPVEPTWDDVAKLRRLLKKFLCVELVLNLGRELCVVDGGVSVTLIVDDDVLSVSSTEDDDETIDEESGLSNPLVMRESMKDGIDEDDDGGADDESERDSSEFENGILPFANCLFAGRGRGK